MVGVFPLTIGVSERPKGHGYSMLEVVDENPYFQRGLILKGHEFHYSYVLDIAKKKDLYFAFKLKRGSGIVDNQEGLCYRNVVATYTHIHALGTQEWAPGIVHASLGYKTH